VDELPFRCGQMSVRREAANVLPVIAGIRDSAVQLVFILGSVTSYQHEQAWGMGVVPTPFPREGKCLGPKREFGSWALTLDSAPAW
jgi:hypothetical protein